MTHVSAARQFDIEGVVQGVGFRPFLFSLAQKYHLTGEVCNTAGGVQVVVEGTEPEICRFAADIINRPPFLASVTSMRTTTLTPRGFACFKIVQTQVSGSRNTLISPDMSVCPECLAELKNPDDPRFEYPFINCTHCGPRFTIIKDLPYDRPKTSMKAFIMCERCQREYDDPSDRRFHAQPNACPVCGPMVFLTDSNGRRINPEKTDPVRFAAQALSDGKIIGVKGLGGFHLACDASCFDAVQRLRVKKNRPHKPFAVMARSLDVLADLVHISPQEKDLLESCHRPIVLLRKKDASATGVSAGLSRDIAPLNSCIGVMLPYTPLHVLLLEKGPDIVVMTSGNRSGEPISIDNADAVSAFCHMADYFLLHNRDIYFRADDSILRVQAKVPRFLRRSRGYAPLPIVLKTPLPGMLGCGAGMKNTICLTRGTDVFLSQHIGDLENVRTEAYFKDSIAHLKRIFNVDPKMVAHDLHPGYASTRYAGSCKNVKTVGIQHHHAHAVSCMAEHHLDEPVLAIVLDGTGYGTDSHIWGGELLVCTRADFERKAHLSYLPMPGGEKAVTEPWRMAAAALHAAFGKDFLTLEIPFIRQMADQNLAVVCQMIDKQLNTPLTSSAGRLFDAVASILCLCHAITHESQAAMQLEAIALDHQRTETEPDPSGFLLHPPEKNAADTAIRIDLTPFIRKMVQEIEARRPAAAIGFDFHHILVNAFAAAAQREKQASGICKIVLSGGVFNNEILLSAMIAQLEKMAFKVYTHTAVPTGDGGICLGQVVAAAAREERA